MYGILPFPAQCSTLLAQLHRGFPLTLLCEDDQSRRMRWARHVACMGRRDMHIVFWWENLKEIDCMEYLGIDVRINEN
jgi:hypothetical protein